MPRIVGRVKTGIYKKDTTSNNDQTEYTAAVIKITPASNLSLINRKTKK